MPYLYLVSALLCLSTLSIFGTAYNRRNAGRKGITALYNLLLCASACVTWGIIYAFDFSFDARALLYSLGFGVCYAVVMISLIKALAKGPIALTSLIVQLSLIGATIWGFMFWNSWDESKASLVITGLVLVVISLALCLFNGSDKRHGARFSWKWLFFAIISFVANAGCSIFQKSEQIALNGEHGSMFMFFSVLLATIICGAYFIFTKKPNVKEVIIHSGVFPLLSGVGSALGNMFVVLLATSDLSPNLIYPAVAVGCLAINSIASAFVFKEKLAWWQWLGILVGAVAVTLLSIS